MLLLAFLPVIAPGSLVLGHDTPGGSEVDQVMSSPSCEAELEDDVTLMNCGRCFRGSMVTYYWDFQAEPIEDPVLCETCIQ